MNRQRHVGPIFYPYIVEPNPSGNYDVWFNAWRELPHIIATFDCEEQARVHAIGLNQSYREQEDLALALRRKIADLQEATAPSASTGRASLVSRLKALLHLT